MEALNINLLSVSLEENSMGKYNDLSKQIVKLVGSEKNIISITHCMTRLRFKLKDETLANTSVLAQTPGIITAQFSGGEYQVVIGNHVSDVYEQIKKDFNLQTTEDPEGKTDTGIINLFTSTITKIITPVLGSLSAAGLIKGLLALLVAIGILNTADGAYSILNAAGDALFMFFPIILGYTSAKTFKLNPILGMVIGGALVYPGLQEALTQGDLLYALFGGTPIQADITSTFFGIPVMFPAAGYTGTVIPIIFAVWFASKIERFCKKRIPDIVGFAITPFIVLCITTVSTMLIIGPVANILNGIIETTVLGLYGFSPVVCAIVIAIVYQPLVILGLHWPLIFIAISNYGTLGYDYIFSMVFVASFAQTAVVLAVLMRSKSRKQKEVCIPAIISGLMCIIEPAIYGVTLRVKRRFVICCLSSIIGAIIITMFSPNMYAPVSGILGFIAFIKPDGDATGVWVAVIASVLTMVAAFAATYFAFEEAYFDDLPDVKEKKTEQMISSPIKGEILELSKASDKAFSSGALGKGALVLPKEGKVYAPFDGVAAAVFPTGHAIGLESDSKIQMLIHIGIDTVKLDGKHFDVKIQQGDRIKKGQLLMTFDIDAIKKEGYNLETPVIITNSNSYNHMKVIAPQELIEANNQVIFSL